MNKILDIQKLNISVDNLLSQKKLISDISFNIKKSEVVALIGESGSGKSLTALSIARLLPSGLKINSGKIFLDDENLFSCTERKMREIRRGKISMIFQEPMNSLNPVMKIYKQINEAIPKVGDNFQEIKNLLISVGINDYDRVMNSFPHQLSGGMRQRVMIAIAIACKPDLLIADEPTTSLDVTIQKQVLELLKELNKKLHMSILFITHDLAVASSIANKIIVMKDGRIVENKEKNIFFTSPDNNYSKALLSSSKMRKYNEIDSIKGDVSVNVSKLHVDFPLKKTKLFEPKKYFKAVKNVSFKVMKNQIHAIVGESGSGKSTIARTIMGLENITSGSIKILGYEANSLGANDSRLLRKKYQMVFQDPFSSLNPRMRIGKILGEGLVYLAPELNKDEVYIKTCNVLDKVDLDKDCLSRYPHEFSGGQRQRIAIARSLILDPEVLICDEPTSSLDVTVQKQVLDLLYKIKNENHMSLIFISHDLNLVSNFADTVSVLKEGEIVEEGKTSDILYTPKHSYTKKLLDSVPQI